MISVTHLMRQDIQLIVQESKIIAFSSPKWIIRVMVATEDKVVKRFLGTSDGT